MRFAYYFATVRKLSKGTKQLTLLEFLQQLNTSDSSNVLYVNRDDISDYRIGNNTIQYDEDTYLRVGPLDELSYGYQSVQDSVLEWIGQQREVKGKRYIKLEWRKGWSSLFDKSALQDAYKLWSDLMHPEFREWLEGQAETVREVWAYEEASLKVEEIQDLLSA